VLCQLSDYCLWRYISRLVLFYASVALLKKSYISKLQKLNTKFPFKPMYFLGVNGLTASFCIAFNYTTIVYTIYTVYIHF